MYEDVEITINGTTLSTGQIMTIHVALNTLASELERNGLGDDEHGRILKQAYSSQISSILKLYMEK